MLILWVFLLCFFVGEFSAGFLYRTKESARVIRYFASRAPESGEVLRIHVPAENSKQKYSGKNNRK